MRKTRLSLVFAAALMPGFGLAESPPVTDAPFDVDAWEARNARAGRELFDLLRADGSPRMQVLAGRVYLSDEDAENPLRPKGEDVVARAASLAPGDAFVQSVAASEGNYHSSQCGPVHWPEAEVANLLRLEPDNAAAWRYAVALAQAKGDQAGIDAALERMAMARRANDHEGEEVAMWTQVFSAHPGAMASPYDEEDKAASPSQTALAAALGRVSFRYSAADSALSRACQPDGSTGQDWRRLDWCARAGRVLAREGDSFALRELGLKLLGKGDGHADLQRQLEWLQANASDPSRSATASADAAADRERDWNDAAGSIAAAERRLARLGKPATPPEGWMAEDAYDESEAAEAADAWLAYLRTVLDAMRASGDAREQVLAVIAERMVASEESAAAEEGAGGRTDDVSIAAIAATRPDDLLVQWIAAHHAEGEAREAAISRLQQLEPSNAAAWSLSLPADVDAADPTPVLLEMAASREYDEYTAGFIGIWKAAFARMPFSPELIAQFQAMETDFDAEAVPAVMAMGAMVHLTMGVAWPKLLGACAPEAAATGSARREHCLAIGRMLLQDGRTVLAARFGEALLRKLDALQGLEAERARQIAWWQDDQLSTMPSGTALDAYFTDWLSTGDEIEALRLAATRAGKAEPPAGWRSPAEKRVKKATP